MKVPKLVGRISGDIILFVSSKRRRFEARNFTAITVLQNERLGVLPMAFRTRKVFGTLEKGALGLFNKKSDLFVFLTTQSKYDNFVLQHGS